MESKISDQLKHSCIKYSLQTTRLNRKYFGNMNYFMEYKNKKYHKRKNVARIKNKNKVICEFCIL